MLLLLACHASPEPEPTGLVVDGDHLSLESERGAVALDAVPIGEGDLAVALAKDGDLVRVVVAGQGTLEGVAMRGAYTLAGSADAVLWRQGYQSWSWSGVVELEEPELVDGVPVAEGDGDVPSIATETASTSWWAGLVGRPGGGALLLGVTGATRTKAYTAFSPDEAWVVWGTRGERIAVDGEVELDPLFVAFGDDTLYEEWAARVEGRPLADPPPVGWSDWYQYYGQATETDLRAQLALATPPMEVFQVDDGWERAWGDWDYGEAFPTGGTLAADIAARGFTPGLWMAPLYVGRDSETYAAHPGWWVRDESGAEIAHGSLMGKDLAILDVTDPEAAAWLRELVAGKVAEGWTYLKLDFLYAGAVEGVRDEDVTGAEAYRLAMEIVREAMGDAPLLACGAPMLPSVGFADSFRTGADIAFAVAPEPDRGFLRWQARNTAARAWANGVWWWNDPDALLVRGLDEAGVRGAVAAQVASGGAWFAGDGMDVVAPPLDLVDLRGGTWRVEDPLAHVSGLDGGPLFEAAAPDDDVPVRWESDDAVVLLNLSDAPVEVERPDGTLRLGTGAGALAPGDGEVWER